MPFRSDNDGVVNFGIVGATHLIPFKKPFGVIGIAGPDPDARNIVDFLALGGAVPRPLGVGSFRNTVPTAGVFGASIGEGTAGVIGENDSAGGIGVAGYSEQGTAVQGESLSQLMGFLAGHDPVFQNRVGAYGQSDVVGVMGLATNDSATGVYGGGASHAGAPGAGSIGVRGETFGGTAVMGHSFGAGLAGKFIGGVDVTGKITAHDVAVTGDISAHDVVLSGGDCAEDFDIADLDAIDPGTVMVIDEAGTLRPCQNPYDKKVTGVISGAGDYKPGIILDKRESTSNRLPLALLGKVYCKVDAEHGSIQIGDLLTTSSTPGHAMKAGDPLKAFGSVIGKALRPIDAGQGLIPILVALQ